MRRLSERRRRLALAVVFLGAAGNALGGFLHAHRVGTVLVGLVVVVQLWLFVLLVMPERKEGV